MNHFCFFALFSSKSRKWNELRSGKTVKQAVSGRLVLASHRTMGLFLLTPVRLTPTSTVSGMLDLLENQSTSSNMNNYRLNQPLPEENSTLDVWGIEFGGF